MKKFIYIFLFFMFSFLIFNENVFAKADPITYDLSEKTMTVAFNAKSNVTKVVVKCNGSDVHIFDSVNTKNVSLTFNYNLANGNYTCNANYYMDGNEAAQAVSKTNIDVIIKEPRTYNAEDNTCVSMMDTQDTDGNSLNYNCKEAGCKWTGNSCVSYTNTSSSSSGSSSNTSSENNSSSDNTSSDSSNGEKITTDNCRILGDFKDDLQEILKMVRMFAPILVAVISVYEYLSVVFMKDASELKKANSRLIKRLILITLLFLLPTFLNIILDLVDTGNYSTCVK